MPLFQASIAAAVSVLTSMLAAPSALAHESHDSGYWNLDPWVVVPMTTAALLYTAGLRTLWLHAGVGRGVRPQQVICFLSGWWVLFVALISPLDAIAGELFSVHMIQHELLMAVAAPLLVLARPLGAWAWAVPRPWRPRLRAGIKHHVVHGGWLVLTGPMSAWALHALALWVWHVPALFNAATVDDTVHALQHASFLASALLFWWAVLGGPSARSRAIAVLLLFTTMIHMGVLGALVALAPRVLYDPYVATTLRRGLHPLEDQQLGGLLMWVPAGTAYLIAGVVLAARLLGPGAATDARTAPDAAR